MSATLQCCVIHGSLMFRASDTATEVAISDSIHGTHTVGNWFGQRQQTFLDEVSRTKALRSHGSFLLFIVAYHQGWLVSDALHRVERYCVFYTISDVFSRQAHTPGKEQWSRVKSGDALRCLASSKRHERLSVLT